MDLADDSSQPRQKDKRNQYQHEADTHHSVVDKERQEPHPEPRVLDARGGISGIRGSGRHTAPNRCRNGRTHHRRPRHCGGNRERLSAIRAKRRTIRHHSATLGTVHGISSLPSCPSQRPTRIAAKSYFQAAAGSIFHRTTPERQKFHSTSTGFSFFANACYSAHLLDFACVYQKMIIFSSSGSFLAPLEWPRSKLKGRKSYAIPYFTLPSHSVSRLFHHCGLVHTAPGSDGGRFPATHTR